MQLISISFSSGGLFVSDSVGLFSLGGYQTINQLLVFSCFTLLFLYSPVEPGVALDLGHLGCAQNYSEY